MADFEIKPQVSELVEKADKNKDRVLEEGEKKLDQETQRVAERLRSFLDGNQDQQKALDKAIREVVAQYKGLSPEDIYQWIREKEVQPTIPETEPGSRRFGRPAEESDLHSAWEQMNAQERKDALREGALALAEKEAIRLSPEQENRLAQLGTLVTLAESYKSFIETQKAESGLSGFLFKANVALNTFKSDPLVFLDRINDFLRDRDRLSADILANPTQTMPQILSKYSEVFKTISTFTTPTFFGAEVGKGIDLANFDCRTPAELNQLRTQTISILRETNYSGGHFQAARQMAMETLGGDFDKVMKTHFTTRKQAVRVGDQIRTMDVVGDLYDKSNTKITEKAHVDEWKQEIKKENPELSDAEIEKKIQSFIESLTYEDYQRERNEAVGDIIYENELFKQWPKDKQDVWDQYKDSMGYGKADISDENWDTVLTEFMINAPLIIVSGGIAAGARAAAMKGLSYGARAVVGGARIAEVAAAAGRYGRIGGRIAGGAAGLAFEGAVFEMTNTGLHGEWIFNSPDWAQRILWSSAALGIFKGAGKLGEGLVGKQGLLKDAMAKITNPTVRQGAEVLAKTHIEVAAMLTLGAAQNGAYNGNVDDFVNNFGEELFKAYVSMGALKVSGKVAETAQRDITSRLKERARERTQKTPLERKAEALSQETQTLDQRNRTAELQNLQRLTEGLKGKELAEFREAFIDPMTGLLNRQGLRLLDQWIANGEKVGVISYDGDHFGAYNKVVGREFGDIVIKTMATEFHELSGRLRAQGFKAETIRMGGEEFVVVSNAPKETMAKEMEQASASLKSRIRSIFSPEQLQKLASHIAASKYSNEPNGIEKAMQEIGGSSAGVSEVQFSNAEPTKAREDLLQYVDEFLEHGKAQERGQVFLDPRSTQRSSKEVSEFRPSNRLESNMNEHLAGIRNELSAEVKSLMEAHAPLSTRLLAEHPTQRQALEEFLKTPTFDKALAERISRETGIGPEALHNAKREYILAIRDHGTYTGADTVRFLERQIASGRFGQPRRLVVSEFKSINEIMGHTYGDTVLTHVHQKVLSEVVRAQGLEGKVIIAQDKADFLLSYENSMTPDARLKFEQATQALYTQRMQELFMRIDTGQLSPVESVRVEWLQRNKSSTLQQSLDAMYSLTIQ